MSIKTFHKIFWASLLIFTSAVTHQVQATHIVGGNLSYTCLGNGEYELKLVVRRDCVFGDEDAQFDDPASIAIYDSFGSLQTFLGTNGQLILPFMGSDTIVDDLENGGCGFIGNGVCVHEATYMGNVQLPNTGFDYILTYQRCCRNGSLTNVIDPLSTGATYSITLSTEAMELCNNSPEFDNWADIYICNNQLINFNHRATDIDGDELVYKLCNPLDGASFDDPFPQPPLGPPYLDVQWSNGFSLQSMLGPGSSLSIDSQTGQLSGVPQSVGQYLIGVCVEEYRNGILLSTTQRDFEYNVVLCAPSFTSIYTYEQEDCTIPTTSFTGLSMQADRFEWFFDYPSTDPLFSSTDQNPVFEFPAAGTYVVRMDATRDIDGCTSSFTDTITVTDQILLSDFELEIVSCANDVVEVSLKDISNSLNPFPLSSRLWLVEYGNEIETFTTEEVVLLLPNDEDISITLSVNADNGCSSVSQQEFEAGTLLPSVEFEIQLNSCSNLNEYEIALNDRTDHQGLTVTGWSWMIAQNGNVEEASGPTVMTTIDGTSLSVELTVNYSNGCNSTTVRDFPVGLDELIADINIVKADCEVFDGVLDAMLYTLTADVDGSILDPAALNYTWIVNGTNINANTQSISYSVVNQTSLNILVEVEYNGCMWSFEQEVNVDALGSPDFDLELSDCNGEDIQITINQTGVPFQGPIIYQTGFRVFENGSLIEDSFDDPLQLTISNTGELIVESYYLFGMSPNECEISKSDTFDIETEILSPLVYTVSKNSCDNGELNYSFSVDQVNANASYEWEYTINGNPFSNANASFDLTLLDGQEVELSLSALFDNGCTSSNMDTSFIVEAANIDFTANVVVPCLGDTVPIFTNFNSSWNYSFVPEVGIVFIDDEPYVLTDQDQVYVVTVSDGLCLEAGQFEVSLSADPSVDIIIEKTDCLDDGTISILVSSTAQNMNITPQSFIYNYSIDGVGATNNNPSFELTLNEGEQLIINLEVVFQNGCVANANQYEETIERPSITFTGDPLVACVGDTVALIANANPDYVYTWNPTTGLIFPNGNTSNALAVAETNITYTVDVMDGACTISESVDIVAINDSYEIEFSGDTIICDSLISLNISNPISGVEYEWSETSDFIDIIQNANQNLSFVVPSIFDSITFYLRPVGLNLECLDNVIGEIQVKNGTKIIDFTYDLLNCEEYTLCFEAINITGEANWDFGDNSNPNSMVLNDASPCFTFGMAGNYMVTLSESNSACNADLITVMIEVPEILSISTNLDSIFYVNDTTVLFTAVTTGNPDSIKWCSDGIEIGMGEELLYDIDHPQTITAKIENEFGCQDSIDIPVRIFSGFNNFEVSTENDTICSADIITLQLFTNMSMSELGIVWSPAECIIAGGNTPNPTVSATESKTFTVNITDLTTNFDTTLSILITVSMPEVEIVSTNGDQIFQGQSPDLEILDPDDFSTYDWSTGQTGTSISVSPGDTTSYSVTVTDEYGCTDVANYTVGVTSAKCTAEDVFLPSAFSPNGDSANDVFLVRSNFIKEMELTVYNRWGEQLFISTDQQFGWDGTYKGEILAPDAFAYCLKVTCVDDQEYVATGNVNLVR